MANRGKHHQTGGGSRRPSQARAEDAARRSRRRASDREWRASWPSEQEDLPEGRRLADFSRDPAMEAMAILHVAAWQLGRELNELGRRVQFPPVMDQEGVRL